MHYLAELKRRLNEIDGVLTIDNVTNPFTVTPIRCTNNEVIGVNVSNLGNAPNLPIYVFVSAISLLIRSDGLRADKGNAIKDRLGTGSMQLNSVEGHIAQVCYGANVGDSVFRRITPIAHILFWAGVIEDPKGHNYLQLMP